MKIKELIKKRWLYENFFRKVKHIEYNLKFFKVIVDIFLNIYILKCIIWIEE